MGDRIEEQVLDENGKLLRTHHYSYNAKGLKIEKKTLDPSGKLVSTRLYAYEF
jgi:hypothetical protein